MPAYNIIAPTETNAEQPITQSLMERLRDNPLAITDHDDTGDPSPRVKADAGASAISSTAAVGSTLVVSSTPSPDGHGNLIIPVTPSGASQMPVPEFSRITKGYHYASTSNPTATATSNEVPIWTEGNSSNITTKALRAETSYCCMAFARRFPDGGGTPRFTHYFMWDMRVTTDEGTLRVTGSTDTESSLLNFAVDVPIDDTWTTVETTAPTSTNVTLQMKARKNGGQVLYQTRLIVAYVSGSSDDDMEASVGLHVTAWN